MNDTKRMKELIEILNNAARLYYQYNTTIMTDFEYDKLYDELVELEAKTGVTLSNSPTVNIEPEISSSLEQVHHPAPMLSLSKTKLIDELEDFLGDKEGLISWKLDGLTIVLTYENGKLVSGVTRGTGIIGEVVTENVKQFKNVPLTISYKDRLVLRGEAVITYSDFKKMNETLGEGSSKYKNPRNLCSGSVRQLDSRITAKRSVNCIIFELIEGKKFDKKDQVFKWLESLGFTPVENFIVTRKNLKEKVLEFKKRVSTYNIPSDGLVLTYNDTKYSDSLGSTAKYPKHSMAFKWQDETAETTLREVYWSASRTGLINPVAVFDPVELEGTIVSRASLHNISILKGLKIGINDKILVYKANMIIPQVADNLTKSNNLKIPTNCPICHHKTQIIRSNDVDYLYCTNDYCIAKTTKRLALFVSRNALNIEGISDAILTKLVDEKMVNNYSDLFHLDKYKDKIISFEGFGPKSYENIINSVEKSRKVKTANFIYALGIPEVGLSRAKLICNKYNNNFQTIRNLSFEKLSEIDGVGEVIAKEWENYFNNEEFKKEVDNLLKEITFSDKKNNSDTLKDQVFVITGSLNHFANRDELIEYIEQNGGKVIKAISTNVNYLINNDISSTSSKNKKAKELNIPIISEEDIIKMSKGEKNV
ncbi:MAG: NAD-dependent DNA ligase LigA [Bacilli bacterium]|nr:NAD-dependent DNA ligase LigA [Bacilli bacterium]